jgi:hypothetical protein
MPLSPPAERQHLHTRAIDLRGYARADGLFDIEAHLLDTKTYPFENEDRGTVVPGEALHGMWVRMTVGEDMVIRPQVTPNFGRLAGVAIGPGFSRAVKERVGGAEGCTHLREVLAQMATVAFQTIGPIRWRKARAAREEAIARGESPPPLKRAVPIGSCYAYAPEGPVVTRMQDQAEE